MRLHIVFELAVGPEVDRGEVDVMAGVAAASFNEAMRPLGACKLARIQAPLEFAKYGADDDGSGRYRCACGTCDVPTVGYVTMRVKRSRGSCALTGD